MKRIISLVMIVVLLFSLCALASCGDAEATNSKVSSQSQSKKPSATTSNKSSSVASNTVESAEESSEPGSAVSSSVSSKESSTKSTKPSSANSKPVSSAQSSTTIELPEYLKNSGEITVYSSVTSYDGSSWWKNFHKYYNDNYNGTVKVVQTSSQTWTNKYIADFASNSAPDIVYLDDKNLYKLVSKGMVCSVDELKAKNVKGFDNSYLASGLNTISRNFKYKGKNYGFAKERIEPTMIFVNEDLFKQYGVKSPTQYYKEGVWNWENFEKCAGEITTIANNKEISGYYGYQDNWIVNAAGGQIVTLKNDGKLALTIDSVQAIQGFENVNIIHKSKYATSTENFSKGKVGMMGTVSFELLVNYLPFAWSMIPYPIDTRTNGEKIVPGLSNAWAVSSSSNNPQGCINYVIAYNTFAKENPNKAEVEVIMQDRFNSEQKSMITSAADKVVIPIYQGVGDLYTAQWDFWTNIKNTKISPKEVVDSYKTKFQQQVELENNSATH